MTILVAIERRLEDVTAVVGAPLYSVGNVQLYKRGRNLLNFIIIPISVAFTILLFVLTFVLRRVRSVSLLYVTERCSSLILYLDMLRNVSTL